MPASSLLVWNDPATGTTVTYAEVESWGRVRVAAGEPKGPVEHRSEGAKAFERDARAAGARALWFGVETPAHLGAGRPSVVVGAEPVWRVQRWPEIVASKRSVRAQIARARNKGVTVETWATDRVVASAELRDVLAAWLDNRGLPPLAFLANPFVLDAPGARRFLIARQGEDVVGYLAMLPGDETFIEWIIRRPGAPNGTAALLLDAAARQLPEEGTFTLGLVPLSTFAPLSETAPSLFVRGLLRWTRAHATRFYNFTGLERFKAKFVPDHWRPLHLVTDGRPITIFTFHDVAAAFAAPRGPTRFIARALADAVVDEGRAAARWLRRRLS